MLGPPLLRFAKKLKEVIFLSDSRGRYWAGVLYPENLRSNWEEEIGDILQLPFAYCQHSGEIDKKGKKTKEHLHLLIAFPNTTTYNNALSVFKRLSAEGKEAINKIEKVIGIRNVYDYLIHDTETAKKQGKKQYSPKDRITGNGFDIAEYQQLTGIERNSLVKDLCDLIIEENFTNFADFYSFVVREYLEIDSSYFEVLRTYSGLFERLTRGNYQKLLFNLEVSERIKRDD